MRRKILSQPGDIHISPKSPMIFQMVSYFLFVGFLFGEGGWGQLSQWAPHMVMRPLRLKTCLLRAKEASASRREDSGKIWTSRMRCGLARQVNAGSLRAPWGIEPLHVSALVELKSSPGTSLTHPDSFSHSLAAPLSTCCHAQSPNPARQ